MSMRSNSPRDNKGDDDDDDVTSDPKNHKPAEMNEDTEEGQHERHHSGSDSPDMTPDKIQTNDRRDMSTPTMDDNKTNDNFGTTVHTSSNELGERLEGVRILLEKERDALGTTRLKDYDRLDGLKSTLEAEMTVLYDYSDTVSTLGQKMAEVRSVLSEISNVMEQKISKEGLTSWLPEPEVTSTDLDVIAKATQATVQAAEARERLVRLQISIAKLEEQSASLEAETADAQHEAEAATELARQASRAAAQARIAAEDKRRADDEADKRREEKRRREEEKRLRDEEATKIKQQQEERETQAEDSENQEEELEIYDPRTVYVYSTEPSDIAIPLGCVLRAVPGMIPGQHSISVRCLDQRACAVNLSDNEELASHIVQLEKNDPFEMVEPLAVAIPHVAPRNATSREPAIKQLDPDGSWTELDTYDVTINGMKEYKFLEVRLNAVDAILAVVTRPKREMLSITKRGGKMIPTVDARISIIVKPMTFKNPANIRVEIQPVELGLVSDLKHRKPRECDNLLASSPIVQLLLPSNRLPKPITLTLPVPPNPHKPRRPLTGLGDKDKSGNRSASRPVSALSSVGQKDGVSEDGLHLLTRSSNEGWSIRQDMPLLHTRNTDSASLELAQPMDDRFVILRARGAATNRNLERMCTAIDQATRERAVQIILRQRSDNPRRVMLQCVPIVKSERYQRKLRDEGYDFGPPPSDSIILHEGQKIKMDFRGNIRDAGNHDDEVVELVYNTHIATRREFNVNIVDHFSQKGLATYRGFCQLFVRGLVSKILSKDEEKAKASQLKSQQKVEMMDGDVLLCELLINLPKPAPQSPKPIVNRTPVCFKAEDILDNDYMRHLAANIGDEWRPLAQHLGIRRMRIQAILRNNVTRDNEAVIYEMLATWAKRIPRSVDKVELLCKALISTGRADLSEEVRDQQNDKRQERQRIFKDSYLKKAFVKIAQKLPIMNEWRHLAVGLGLSNDLINGIDNVHPGIRDKVTTCLVTWVDRTGEDADIILLLNVLKQCNWANIASDIQSELGVY